MPEIAQRVTQVEPMDDRVLVQRLTTGEMRRGSIIVPETVTDARPSQEAVVERVGRGRLTDQGTLAPMRVQVGDYVLLTAFAGTEVKIDGAPYTLVREDDILAFVREVT